jgi:hypothetical protein
LTNVEEKTRDYPGVIISSSCRKEDLMDVSPGHNHDGLKKTAKGAIGEQLERMVASPYLSHSTFLR